MQHPLQKMFNVAASDLNTGLSTPCYEVVTSCGMSFCKYVLQYPNFLFKCVVAYYKFRYLAASSEEIHVEKSCAASYTSIATISSSLLFCCNNSLLAFSVDIYTICLCCRSYPEFLMANLKEKCYCVKFVFSVGRTAYQAYEIKRKVFTKVQ